MDRNFDFCKWWIEIQLAANRLTYVRLRFLVTSFERTPLSWQRSLFGWYYTGGKPCDCLCGGPLIYLLVLGFELRALCMLSRHSTTWATLPALFCVGDFWDKVLWTICQGWPWAEIFLISVSWIARIIGMSHQCPAVVALLLCRYNGFQNSIG
jgi:hypothetical protein